MNKDNSPVLEGASEHNYGIDLLKITAMMFICVLHVCTQGGLASSLSLSSSPDNYRMVFFLESLTFCSVNVYAMVSGYVGYKKTFKLSRPVMIWLELVFYMVAGLILISAFAPDIAKSTEASWFKALMPVMNRQYWYMTAYFGMVILMPLLNVVVQKTSIRTLSLVLLAVLVFYCAMTTMMDSTAFNLSSGYTTIWLCLMYIAGGYLARINKPHPLVSFGIYLLMVVVTWLLRVEGMKNVLRYTSPTVVIAAAALVMTFSQIKVRCKISKKIIPYVAASTLGIYLAHVNDFIFANKGILKGFATRFKSDHVMLLLAKVLLFGLGIFLIGLIIDSIRRGLFRLLHIKPLLKRVDKQLESAFAKKEPKEEAPDASSQGADGEKPEQ